MRLCRMRRRVEAGRHFNSEIQFSLITIFNTGNSRGELWGGGSVWGSGEGERKMTEAAKGQNDHTGVADSASAPGSFPPRLITLTLALTRLPSFNPIHRHGSPPFFFHSQLPLPTPTPNSLLPHDALLQDEKQAPQRGQPRSFARSPPRGRRCVPEEGLRVARACPGA